MALSTHTSHDSASNSTKSKDVLQKLIAHQTRLFTALGSRHRVAIMIDILQHGERTVLDLLELIQVDRASLSRHLAKLRSAGLITVRSQGRRDFYTIANQKVADMLQLAETLR